MSPPRPRHLLIEASTYLLNNTGDSAMLDSLAAAWRRLHPGGTCALLTADPAGLARLHPDIAPVFVPNRQRWWLGASPLAGEEHDGPGALELLRLFTSPTDHAGPILRRQLGEPDARCHAAWRHAVAGADAVAAMGGGYHCPSFIEHTVRVLATLDLAANLGKTVFSTGCGFEPCDDHPRFASIARAVMPRLAWIAAREGVLSPRVLASYGVDPGNIDVWGDDAVPVAHVPDPPSEGRDRVLVNVRTAHYSGMAAEATAELLAAAESAASALGLEPLRFPISHAFPDDLEEMRRAQPNPAAEPADPPRSPAALRAALARARVVVTGSYHGAVFALSQGVPTVMIAASPHYRNKLAGLVATFDAPAAWILDPRDGPLAPRVAAKVGELAGLRPPLAFLLHAAARQISAAEQAWSRRAAALAHAPATTATSPAPATIAAFARRRPHGWMPQLLHRALRRLRRRLGLPHAP